MILTVYVDILFLLNFIYDAEILCLLCKIYSRRVKPLRLIFSSLMGGIQGIFFFIPYFRIFSVFPIGLFFPLLLIWIALYPIKLRELFKGYFVFLSIAFIFSGLLLFFSIKAKYGIFFIIPVYLLLDLLKKKAKIIRYETELTYGEKNVKVLGLYDSGNKVFYLDKPVIFGNKEICIKLFGNEKIEKSKIHDEDFCVVPYKTVRGSGVCYGVKLKEVLVNKKKYDNVIIAIFDADLEEEVILNGIMA